MQTWGVSRPRPNHRVEAGGKRGFQVYVPALHQGPLTGWIGKIRDFFCIMFSPSVAF